MNKVVVLGVIAVVAVGATVALGMVRPSSGGGDPSSPGAIEAVRRWLPAREVNAADLASEPCWDTTGHLTVPPGATCVTHLPAKATRLTLCLTAGTVLDVRVTGTKYGPQRLKGAALACAAPRVTDLYDESQLLVVTCAAVKPCLLELH